MKNKKYSKGTEASYLKKYSTQSENKNVGMAVLLYYNAKMSSVKKEEKKISLNKVKSASTIKSSLEMKKVKEEKKQVPLAKMKPTSSVVELKSAVGVSENKQIKNPETVVRIPKRVAQAEENSEPIYQQNYYKQKGVSYRRQKLGEKKEPVKNQQLHKMMKESVERFNQKLIINQKSSKKGTHKYKTTSLLEFFKSTHKIHPIIMEESCEESLIEQQKQSIKQNNSVLIQSQGLESMISQKSKQFGDISHIEVEIDKKVSQCSLSSIFNQGVQFDKEEEKTDQNNLPVPFKFYKNKSSFKDLVVDKKDQDEKEGQQKRREINHQQLNENQNFDMFQDFFPGQEVSIDKNVIESFNFMQISHPQVRFQYMLNPKQSQVKQDDKISPNDSQKREDIHIVQIDDKEQSGREESIIYSNNSESQDAHETRSFIVDDDGNVIERIEVELKDFGYCHLMAVKQEEELQCQSQLIVN